MIFLELFWTFFKIGLFTFGGGYAMIPLIQQEVLSKSWIEEGMLYNFIGISEATPGPIAINMATFVGSTVGNMGGSALLGSIVATLGVVLPSFVIIIIIAALLKNFSKSKAVKNVLGGIKPVVIGLILGAGALLVYSNLFQEKFDYVSLIMMIAIAACAFVYKKITKKDLSPIIMILISSGFGMIVYSVF